MGFIKNIFAKTFQRMEARFYSSKIPVGHRSCGRGVPGLSPQPVEPSARGLSGRSPSPGTRVWWRLNMSKWGTPGSRESSRLVTCEQKHRGGWAEEGGRRGRWQLEGTAGRRDLGRHA